MQSESTHKILNEEETIELIWKVLDHGRHRGKDTSSWDPFSDDAAWLPNHKASRLIVFKADMLVSDTDAPPQMTPKQIASKAVVSVVSDFAAKGVQPSYCTISLAVPKEKAEYGCIRSLAEGFDTACAKYGIRIVSGDTNGSKDGLVIDLSAFGFANSVIKRNGAKPGDLIGVTGRFGLQNCGLSFLLGKSKYNDNSFRKRAEKTVLEPKARLSLGISISRFLSSSIDSSDGLALSLYHIAESSKVDLCLDMIPIAKGVKEFAVSNHVDQDDLALFGGEEYELVVTFNPRYEEHLKAKGIITIGRVRRARDYRKPLVYFTKRLIQRKGWIHNQQNSDEKVIE